MVSNFPTSDKQQTPEEILQAFDNYAVDETKVRYEHFVAYKEIDESKSFYNCVKNLWLLQQLFGVDTAWLNYLVDMEVPNTSRIAKSERVEVAKVH